MIKCIFWKVMWVSKNTKYLINVVSSLVVGLHTTRIFVHEISTHVHEMLKIHHESGFMQI